MPRVLALSVWMAELIAAHRFPTGQILQLIYGDLTEEPVDAIVNAANARLQHGGGVAAAIVRRGGPHIQAESDAWVRQHGPVTHDRPAVTGAGRLACRAVIHAVGPVWGAGDEDAKLQAAVCGALRVAESLQIGSLALPAISTGIFGFPRERAAKIMLQAITDHCSGQDASSLREIHITLIDMPTLAVFTQEFKDRWPEPLASP